MIIRSRQLNVPILFPNEEVRDRGAPVCELESDDRRRRNGSQSGGEGFNANGEAARGAGFIFYSVSAQARVGEEDGVEK